MVVELACECGDLPAHSHIFRTELIPDKPYNRLEQVDTGEVRIWVDWKAVARDLIGAARAGDDR